MNRHHRQLISANQAAGTAALFAARANRCGRGFGSGVYPITPQSECIEFLAKQEIEKGHIVTVESEHSAMAVSMGFSLGGARAFTASSANGLAYMAENVFAAALYRLPIVMMAVNRALGPPWNIWVDHGDTLMLRDSGWVQFYCVDNQEVLDTVLAAFRLAEDARVFLPVLVCQDAFILSHTMMMTEVPEQDSVDAFLPLLDLPYRLTLRPRTIGGLDFPHVHEVHRREMAEAMAKVPFVYRECQENFQAIFNRSLADAVVPYRMEDAQVALLSMGTAASTVERVVDVARERGEKLGAIRVRLFRPFPEAELRQALARTQKIGVIDRDLCPGLGGILWSECRPVAPAAAFVQNYIAGLGGGDLRPEHILWILEDLKKRDKAGEPRILEVGL